MNRVIATSLKVTATAVTLLIVATCAGVAYTWYMSEYHSPDPSTFQQTAQAGGGSQLPQRKKIPDDAVIGASVQTITSPVVPGSNASIMVKTNPEALCTITVVYDKTPSKDSGLTQKKADEFGLVEWAWTVEPNVPLGDWPVTVTCANKKNKAEVENDLRVVKTLE